MNVLSLFDGISCGKVALDMAGVNVESYFASEVDKYAIKVSKDNHPSIAHLGDVKEVKGGSLPKIDLLIGGSPCQGFSFAGKQLNFDDPRSSLFFEYKRLLDECNPDYFLLENVAMKREYSDVISGLLGVEPVKINSSSFTPHNRPRLYWTNIPFSPVAHDRAGGVVSDILDEEGPYDFIPEEKTVNRVLKKTYLQYDINGRGNNSQDQRAYRLTGIHGCLDTGAASKAKILTEDGRVRKTTRLEAERLQGLPDGYTDSVSRSQAMKALGNGWTVDVVAHIFKGLNLKKGR